MLKEVIYGIFMVGVSSNVKRRLAGFKGNTPQNMPFPTMQIEDHVPISDVVHDCMGFSWTQMDQTYTRVYDKYLEFRNMPECEQLETNSGQWESDYPTHA